jgi:hypothetical protein
MEIQAWLWTKLRQYSTNAKGMQDRLKCLHSFYFG